MVHLKIDIGDAHLCPAGNHVAARAVAKLEDTGGGIEQRDVAVIAARNSGNGVARVRAALRGHVDGGAQRIDRDFEARARDKRIR